MKELIKWLLVVAAALVPPIIGLKVLTYMPGDNVYTYITSGAIGGLIGLALVFILVKAFGLDKPSCK